MARANPEDWVLKPQREGGGNNFYDQEIVEKLDKSTLEELKQYILMKKIKATPSPAIFMRDNVKHSCTRISELGVYGIVLSDPNGIQINESAGSLLRSKFSEANETGVAAGFGVLDSVLLV